MSDNEDLLADDLGDQSLADYNLGNEEEDQLLADDYESGGPQNVPVSIGDGYNGTSGMVPSDYSNHEIQYAPPPMQYHQPMVDTECVVPNIRVEVPNLPPHSTYTSIKPRQYEIEHAVPPAIPAGPSESPQIVPSESTIALPNMNEQARERFMAERPVGPHRMPQVRDIPDSLDKVVIPRGFPRQRAWWRAAPHRRHYVGRGHFSQRNSFPPPHQVIRPNIPPQIIRQEIRPQIRPEIINPEIRPDMIRPQSRPEMNRPDMRSEMNRPDIRSEMNRPDVRPDMNRRDILPDMNRPDIRPDMNRPDIRPAINHPDIRPEINHPTIQPEMMRRESHPEIIRPNLHPEMIRPDLPPQMVRPEMRMEIRPDIIGQDMVPPGVPQSEMILSELRPNMSRMGPEISPERPILPDMSFRHPIDQPPFQPMPRFQCRPEERPMFQPMRPNFERPMYPFPRQFNPRFGPVREIVANSSQIPQVTIRQVPEQMMTKEPEVRMLPVPLPPLIPPAGLAGKKVLINPHFKGNFQPPVEGGPIKDIDDAAERFIAEQRNALARAATRKFTRRSPQRYIENTTIEIENELAHRPPRRRSLDEDDDLLRRQEEFIHANRAGLRRRMRTPSPPRRSPSPRRRDPRNDEESEYKRRVREQETLRERVLRAKEVRRRKNAVALHKQMQDREREPLDKTEQPKDNQPVPQISKDKEPSNKPDPLDKPTSTVETKPDTTRRTPDRRTPEKIEKPKIVEKERVREKTPPITAKDDEVNSTCEGLTPPLTRARSPSPPPFSDDDDELDMILGDIDGILSEEEDTGRFKDKPDKPEPPNLKPKPVTDLRAKLPPKPAAEVKPPRQKIIFTRDKEDRKRKERTPPRRPLVTSSKPDNDGANKNDGGNVKVKPYPELQTKKQRQRIIFENKDKEIEKEKPTQFTNRRVILQRKPTKDKSVFSRMETNDRSQSNPMHNIFSRAVRTAIGDTKIAAKRDEPQIEYESESDIDEDKLLNDEIGVVAVVSNLPPGITETRIKTLAGKEIQVTLRSLLVF